MMTDRTFAMVSISAIGRYVCMLFVLVWEYYLPNFFG